MASYIIDFETASGAMPDWKDKLRAGDRAFVFHQNDHAEIPKGAPICLTSKHAMIRYIKINADDQTAASMQISSYIGYLIASGNDGEISILSSNPSFEPVIEFWRGINPQLTINRIQASSPGTAKAPKKCDKNNASRTCRKNAEQKSPANVKNPKSKTEQRKNNNAKAPQTRDRSEKSNEQTIAADSRKKLRVKLRAIGLDESAFSKFLTIYTKAKDKQELNISLVRAFTQETGNKIYKSIVKDFDKLTSRKSDSNK